jgi:uncharacterized membrane protein
LLAACAGFAFAAVSTYDFAAHLDRQVHGIHCSFLPGLGAADTGHTGCHVTLMSPYSSVFRSSIWGGIPISLPAMSVFAFLAFFALWLMLRDRQSDPRATGFALAASALPALASLVMAYISFAQLGAACKLCIGIYVASGTALLAALLLWSDARRASAVVGAQEPLPTAGLALSFGLGVLFVALPVTTYAISAPAFDRYVGTCGQLTYAPDSKLLVPLGPQGRPTALLEVLDPLCPSCRGFEERFSRMDAAETISRQALLFPLDNACNWMVSDAIHPGACAISEAMFCAGDRAGEVLDWSFENQDAIMLAARADAKAGARRLVAERFPELGRCLGTSAVQAKLNLALRYAVKNRLQVLTPQVFVQGLRLCDEDTDLGLEYALPRLIERARTQPPELKPAGSAAPSASIAVQQSPRPRAAPVATPTAVAPAPPRAANTEAVEPAAPPLEPPPEPPPSPAEPTAADVEAYP